MVLEKNGVLALNLGYPSIALEQRNTKSMLSHSIKQGPGHIHHMVYHNS